MAEDTDTEDMPHQDIIGTRKNDSSFAAFWKQFKMNFSSASGILLALWWVFTVCFIVFPGTFYDSYFDMLSGIEDEDTRTGWYDIAIIL